MLRRIVRIILLLMLGAMLIQQHAAAQSNSRFFPETGQTINTSQGFLAFWETHQALIGLPLTGVIIEGNLAVQYFESSRLEAHPDGVRVGALGREYTRWRTFAAPPARAPRESEQSFANGHTLTPPFREFWTAHHGPILLGDPISEPLWETIEGANIRVQYFERGRLEQPLIGQSNVGVGKLGRSLALARGLLTPEQSLAVALPAVEVDASGPAFAAIPQLPTPTPVPPTPLPTPLPQPTSIQRPPAVPTRRAVRPTPKPTARVTAPKVSAAGKVIDVNLSKQWLYAYEDGREVYRAPIATGKDGFKTPTGTYGIYAKLPLRTMRGSANGEEWVVPDVPHVMYIVGGVALHGTYWHNMFGTGVRMSHGCINLSLRDAAWLYKWAPVGTKVVVHY